MKDLTVLILTLNEEPNIRGTLRALGWASEIVLVDSGSTDRTVELAKAAHPNVRIVQRPFDSHPNQWNFGLDQITTEWVLTLDADYEVSPELAAEIQALNPASDLIGYWAEFEYRIFGHRLRGSSYPPRIVLFRVSHARYVDDGHTQTLWIRDAAGELRPPPTREDRGRRTEDGRQRTEDGKLAASPTAERSAVGLLGPLAGRIYHDDRKPLGRWIREQDRYAKLEARHLLSKPISSLSSQDRLRRWIFFAAPAMFLYLLFGRGLILDGWPGWFYVAQRTIAEFLLSMRLLIASKELEERS